MKYIRPDFSEDAFAGTANYYAQFRVPYPKVLIDDLLERAGVLGDGKLLDLACGPGRIAIPLASSFREVWAIDLEPEMIEVARQEAKDRGVPNVTWMVGKAEDLALEPFAYQLITIGDAFHRLDHWLIAKQAFHWLSTGSCLAVMGCYNLQRGTEPWQRIIVDTVGKWVDGNASTDEPSAKPEPGSGSDESVLRDAGFSDVESFSFVHPQIWTLETIVGHLYSTSRCSKKVLGDATADFEADLKRSLIKHDPRERYSENLRFGYTLARKPR